MKLSRRKLLGGAICTWLGGRAFGAPSRNWALIGVDDPPPPALQLRAGVVTAEFEPGTGFLRYVRYGDQELLRGAYVAVRDKVWGTVTPQIKNVVLESREQSFSLEFEVECRQGDVDFAWEGLVTGKIDGTIRFEMNGKARSTFQKNRIGFAVLHPLNECAGKECIVETASGKVHNTKFPDGISPNQPFFDVRAITHKLEGGLEAVVRMEGDVFETEDHRNWSDGNFKTYCTPLALPFPVEVKRDAVIKQSVTISLKGKAEPIRFERAADVAVEIKGDPLPLPKIGTAFTGDRGSIERLRAARLEHLRVDLRMGSPDWKQQLDQAAAVGLPLELAVFLDDKPDEELAALAKAARGLKIAWWLVFHSKENSTKERWLRSARTALNGLGLIGGGANVYFTELNRERPVADLLDLACYSVNPQVHAFDNRSLMENLSPQGDQVRSARKFLGNKPIAVTPVTLRPRFNPQAVGPSGPPAESRFDPRQKSLLAAAWTVGSVKYLAEAGASSATYYEAAGPAGLMDSGGVYPLYHVLADVAEFSGADVAPCTSADDLRVVGLALQRTETSRRILLANLTNEVQLVKLWDGWLGTRVEMRRLDEHSYEEATRRPEAFRKTQGEFIDLAQGRLEVALLPYGVTRLDRI